MPDFLVLKRLRKLNKNDPQAKASLQRNVVMFIVTARLYTLNINIHTLYIYMII